MLLFFFFSCPHWILEQNLSVSIPVKYPFSPWKEQVGAKCVTVTCSQQGFGLAVDWRQAVSRLEADTVSTSGRWGTVLGL